MKEAIEASVGSESYSHRHILINGLGEVDIALLSGELSYGRGIVRDLKRADRLSEVEFTRLDIRYGCSSLCLCLIKERSIQIKALATRREAKEERCASYRIESFAY